MPTATTFGRRRRAQPSASSSIPVVGVLERLDCWCMFLPDDIYGDVQRADELDPQYTLPHL
jgi:hypothetical protein